MSTAIFSTAGCHECASVAPVKCVITGCHHCLHTDWSVADDQIPSRCSQEQLHPPRLWQDLLFRWMQMVALAHEHSRRPAVGILGFVLLPGHALSLLIDGFFTFLFKWSTVQPTEAARTRLMWTSVADSLFRL